MLALIVDDARVMRLLLRRALDSLGFSTQEAASGAEGLTLLAQAVPDVVLVDCNMPDMHGFEFVRRLRSQPGLAELPVLMVSADVDSAQPQRVAEAGANGSLGKPFNQQSLRTALTDLGVMRVPS
jgi:two-component system chemotaxis response regulator CheY